MNKKMVTVLCISAFFALAACTDNKTKEKQDSAPPVTPIEQKAELRHIQMDEPNTFTMRKSKDLASVYGRAEVESFADMPAPRHPVVLPSSKGWNRESYNAIEENDFISSINDPLSTFSIDVDTASYANIRRFVTGGSLPPVGAVRIEEMVNYFHYNYPEPIGNKPVAISTEVGPSPFNKDYSLVQIGVKAKDIEVENLPPSNLVFLIDVSGSMSAPNKLGLLKKSMNMLVSKLDEKDRVSIVVYAGSDRIVLQPTPGSELKRIREAIDNLASGGSTHASSGIATAYQLARQVFMPGGNNRVILASDGDFNVGTTSRGELQKLIEKERESGVYLTVLGFGMGNYHDDTMEVLADKGNGNYAYIDSLLEAKKVLVKEMGGTLFTVASDVKIQVEFNPAQVGAYRLIGYENRALANEDFKDDTKDAGEIGAGHTVTALYELIPTGHKSIPVVDDLKYQKTGKVKGESNELLTVKLRYKPEGAKSSKQLSQPVKANKKSLAETSDDFRFAATVAGYGMLLKNSTHTGEFSYENCLELLKQSRGADNDGYRAELLRLVEMSQLLQNEQK